MTALRRAGLLLVGAGLLCTAAVLGLRWVDSAAVPVVVAQAALPVAGLVAAVLTVLAVLLRGRVLVAAGLVVVAAFAAVGAPSLGRGTVPAARDDLVVVAANLEYGQGDAADVMAAVHRLDADVVVLAEVTPAALGRLDALGLSAYGARSGAALPGATGLMVCSRLPLESVDWGDGAAPPWSPATARITTSWGPVVVRAAHTYAPNLHDDARWRASLGEYRTWMQERHRDEPVVVAGDLNSGWGHPAFRALAQGYTDAHRAAGQGWVRTWPAGRAYPPFTQLDHVLVRGLDVVAAGTVDVRSTDHRAVWARLRHR